MDPPFDSVVLQSKVLQSKVRATGTITALLFKPRNVQVRLPPRKRAHAPHPRACRMRVATAHPSVCGMTPVGARSVRNRRSCSCRPVVWLVVQCDELRYAISLANHQMYVLLCAQPDLLFPNRCCPFSDCGDSAPISPR